MATQTPDIDQLIKKMKDLETTREELKASLAKRIQTDIEIAKEMLEELQAAYATVVGATTRATVAARVSRGRPPKTSGKRVRMTSSQSASLKVKILAAKLPKEGGTMKDIAKVTGPIPFGALRRITNELLEEKKMTKTGQKAKTRYFIA
jgi:hypothetical protein